MSLKKDQSSHLLVICHDEQDFISISEVLRGYFPDNNNQTTLLISNKYYRAKVCLQWKAWNDAMNFESLQENNESNYKKEGQIQQKPQSNNQGQKTVPKYDLMIMIVNQNQQDIINFQSLDNIIQAFNPEQFVLLINTTTPENSWKHQETILQKCNNFIEIVKEDLIKIRKQIPTWSRGALLSNEEEANESGIFSILDRMQTTRWTEIISANQNQLQNKTDNKVQESKTQPQNKMTQQQNEPSSQSPNCPKKSQTTQPNHHPQAQTKPQKQQADSSEGQQLDDKKLQKQMMEFENMMSQMMSFKMQSTGMKNDERKQKAQLLFSNMFKGMMDHQ